MKYLRVVVLLFLVWPTMVQATGLEYIRDYARLYLATAIMVKSYPDSLVGTGFLTRSPSDPHKFVLTTNKHLVEKGKELELQIPIADTNWLIIETYKFKVPLYKDTTTQFYTPESDLDIALILVDRQMLQTSRSVTKFASLSYSFYTVMENLIPGQSVLFAGYPLNLTVNEIQPLLRRGTIAGIDTVKNIIYLDADVFPGSSGSPVFINYDSPLHAEFLGSTKQILVGVISGYKPFKKRFRNIETGKIEMIQTENSGIAIVVPAEKIRAFADSLFSNQK